MKCVTVLNSTSGCLTIFRNETDIERSNVIKAIEGISIGPEKINDVEGPVIDAIKDMFDSMDTIEHIESESQMPADADMTIFLQDGFPFVWANDKDENKGIFVGELFGNCIDKFMIHNMSTFTANVRRLSNEIEQRSRQRAGLTNYHDSDVFEKDFAALTQIRERCLKLADKIKKLQENLTHAEYTA